MRALYFAGMIFFLNLPQAKAETEMQAVVCELVMPSLLEFISTLSSAADTFSRMYVEEMDAATKEVFATVADRNTAMKLAAEEFRREFVLACFGSE
jgi:hypothetical protein